MTRIMSCMHTGVMEVLRNHCLLSCIQIKVVSLSYIYEVVRLLFVLPTSFSCCIVFFASRDFFDDLDCIKIEDLAPWLMLAFVLSREVPALFQKVKHFFPVIYIYIYIY